ncbi:MAG: amino acid ABC transporter substrate-binding protein [Gemmatimonadaceae bacterium]|nr:amino acid ABC transporter substrate-binding protein [Chitinophagaceae bacterium]
MKKDISFFALLTAILLAYFPMAVNAQADTAMRRNVVAVFTPLYLDSAFSPTGEYKYGKQFPKFINPGLEFYEGVQLALDSLKNEKVQLDVYIYDTRSATQTLQQQISQAESQHTGLMIGHVTPAESRLLASAALRNNIPFINANLPNDAGITGNASLVLLNTTLKTHCEGLYRFLQKNYATSPIIYLAKKGPQEDRLKQYISDYEKSMAGVKLRIKYVPYEDNSAENLTKLLDSNRLHIVISGSLDEMYGKKIAQQLALTAKTYPTILVGMPTWDGITDFHKKEFRGQDILYSTPFYNAQTDKLSISINNYFRDVLFARPSDMVFRGYECLYRFGKLLTEKKSNLGSSIGEKKFKVFTDFDIQPVLNKQTMTLDYFENKKLYFVKKQDGVVKGVY